MSNQTGITLAFTFGEAEPVLKENWLDYLGTFLDLSGEYYRPPADQDGLAKMMGANAHHGPTLHFKKNMILKWFRPSRYLARGVLERLALDYLVTGNCYPQLIKNRLGGLIRIERQPGIAMRRMRRKDKFLRIEQDGSPTEFGAGEILHLKEPDIKQDIYGVPEYLGGIQSVLLGEDATLFRRKYYINGAHMGYILVTNDANLDDATAQAIETKVKESKGPGNFRSLSLNIPRSAAREPVKVIPVGDIGTKDEFAAIKNITKQEILSMHRMQPGLSGIIPENTAGFGDLEKSMRVYYELEITAMQAVFLALNEMLGREIVSFEEPDWKTRPTEAGQPH
jgi:PBSX family phage portal protein